MYTSNFDRDSEYWNAYYMSHKSAPPSLFAKSIEKYLQPSKKILDLGCGNGRDSLFFYDKGLIVTAIDASAKIIDLLKSEHADKNIEFICDNFVNSSKVLYGGGGGQQDFCYSRFTIHSIDENQELELLKNIYGVLNISGKFFIEVRSINDDIFGLGECVGRNAYIYNAHFRRFIVKSELENHLLDVGFKINYSEEKRGFAPYRDSDPPIIRIIAEKV